ncbi:6,7-dimethyl-8-ribityllumazine synthase [Ascosphaera apis ARSEF 7405]|uniref:6,7-dimethyl-8-ribityllumazine synthase n=1 Tax=Ascosphaera apis ARSEF 7405 TaxID=392613 RepID=A0A167YGL1_9EURO|nr:6,7-dimethyl-8-ribityllumazine synthase [Ascosphaera apis ARSEF 7405]
MSGLKGPGQAESHDGSTLRVGIVHARWNVKIIDALVDGAKRELLNAGVKEENIVIQSVPGSYELPYAVQRMYNASHVQSAAISTSGTTDLLDTPTTSTAPADTSSSTASTKPFDAIIAIGCLIKGHTMHFEYISETVSHALMRVQLDAGVPVVFGLLTVLSEEQGLVRAGFEVEGMKKMHNHGEDWGRAAVELGVKRRGWEEGKFLN